MTPSWLDQVKWNSDGLVPCIAQDATSQQILMLAWINREALALTAQTGIAHYWSRSRQKIWRKGEESGHLQYVKATRLDCDNDAIVLQVEQKGGIACHTGRKSCFFQKLEGEQWLITDKIIKSPHDIYDNLK